MATKTRREKKAAMNKDSHIGSPTHVGPVQGEKFGVARMLVRKKVQHGTGKHPRD